MREFFNSTQVKINVPEMYEAKKLKLHQNITETIRQIYL